MNLLVNWRYVSLFTTCWWVWSYIQKEVFMKRDLNHLGNWHLCLVVFQGLIDAHEQFKATLGEADKEYSTIVSLSQEVGRLCQQHGITLPDNPYTTLHAKVGILLIISCYEVYTCCFGLLKLVLSKVYDSLDNILYTFILL